MKEKGAYLVPTLVAPGDVIEGARTSGGLPPEMIAKAERIRSLHRAAVSAAIASGVKIAMGTDAAVGPHGKNLRELGEMVRCGMTPMQAIEASTRVPAELLRRSDLGTLAAGKLADVVAVRGDPLADPVTSALWSGTAALRTTSGRGRGRFSPRRCRGRGRPRKEGSARRPPCRAGHRGPATTGMPSPAAGPRGAARSADRARSGARTCRMKLRR